MNRNNSPALPTWREALRIAFRLSMAPLGALLLCLMFGGLAWIRLGEPLAPGTAPFSDEELAACLADRALPVRSDTNCVVEPVDLLVCE